MYENKKNMHTVVRQSATNVVYMPTNFTLESSSGANADGPGLPGGPCKPVLPCGP